MCGTFIEVVIVAMKMSFRFTIDRIDQIMYRSFKYLIRNSSKIYFGCQLDGLIDRPYNNLLKVKFINLAKLWFHAGLSV